MVADITKRADNFRSQVVLTIFQNGKVKKTPLLIVGVVPNSVLGIQTQHYVIIHGRVFTNLQTWTLDLDFFSFSQKLITSSKYMVALAIKIILRL